MKLTFASLRRFCNSATYRLALTYLVLIMLMSIGFSVVFYRTSWHELGRQIPSDNYVDRSLDVFTDRDGRFDDFLQQRIDEGRNELLARLVMLNGLALVIGGVLSYYLARRTLSPIEKAMEAQSRFVGDASHELRTPLTAIQTANEVALRKQKLTIAEAKTLLRQNIEEAAKLKELSDGLLNLARQDSTGITMVAVSLQSVVADAMTHIVRQAQEKGITVHDETPNTNVLGNEQSLAQVLIILLDNAIKYSGERTAVRIAARQKGRYTYVTVRDEGQGIRASDIPHIFRRFYRADQSRSKTNGGGYGLGLSIAQKIIDLHDGAIHVESTPGKGSTFTLKLHTAKDPQPNRQS